MKVDNVSQTEVEIEIETVIGGEMTISIVVGIENHTMNVNMNRNLNQITKKSTFRNITITDIKQVFK